MWVGMYGEGLPLSAASSGFWMSDKPLVQQQLAADLAGILLEMPDKSKVWNFYKGFWDELIRDWSTLDRYRWVKHSVMDLGLCSISVTASTSITC